MTEQTPQPEVLGGTEEQKGRPIPEVSEVSAVVTPSSQQVDTDALAAKLADMILPKFEEQARKRAQSVFDKTSYQFETMAEYLKAAGGDPKKAAREMALDQVAQREMSRQTSEPEVPGRTKGEDDETRTARFLNDLKDESGVELTDEDLHKVWDGKRYTNWADAEKDAKKAAWKKAKGESVGAGAAATGGGKTPPAETDLTEKYKTEMLAARGQGAARGREIRTKYRELGVDVDRVVIARENVPERSPRDEKIDITRPAK